jgi:dihydropteroate synthase
VGNKKIFWKLETQNLKLCTMRPAFTWQLRTRSLELGERTLIMGVLNVTPDSFSDGGRFFDRGAAIEQGLQLLEEGADILDIGGESTRPGARIDALGRAEPAAVTRQEELRRVMPVVQGILARRPGSILSVDTYKAEVARQAVTAGAEIANDVSGLRWDTAMASTIAELNCGLVLMHMRGRPEEWRKLPPLDDGLGLVKRELGEMAEAALQAGIARQRIVLDPGLGFGKSFEENYPLIAGLNEFHALGYPLLAGPSRKSFIGRTLRRNGLDAAPEQRLYGSLAAATACILGGAHLVRVHDVRAAVDAAKIADAVLKAQTT